MLKQNIKSGEFVIENFAHRVSQHFSSVNDSTDCSIREFDQT